jgi:hypothetical protein
MDERVNRYQVGRITDIPAGVVGRMKLFMDSAKLPMLTWRLGDGTVVQVHRILSEDIIRVWAKKVEIGPDFMLGACGFFFTCAEDGQLKSTTYQPSVYEYSSLKYQIVTKLKTLTGGLWQEQVYYKNNISVYEFGQIAGLYLGGDYYINGYSLNYANARIHFNTAPVYDINNNMALWGSSAGVWLVTSSNNYIELIQLYTKLNENQTLCFAHVYKLISELPGVPDYGGAISPFGVIYLDEGGSIRYGGRSYVDTYARNSYYKGKTIIAFGLPFNNLLNEKMMETKSSEPFIFYIRDEYLLNNLNYIKDWFSLIDGNNVAVAFPYEENGFRTNNTKLMELLRLLEGNQSGEVI